MTDETNTLDEVIEPVDTEQQEETEVIDQPEGETTEAETGDKVVEPWMETENEPTDPEQEKPESVSFRAYLKSKKKFQARESALADELELARRELERVKAQSFDKPMSTSTRPKEWDFETDEDYQAAIEKWEDERLDAKLETRAQVRARKEAEEREKHNITAALDSHFERADKLIKESGIAPDVYAAADTTFRNAIDSIMPGNGDAVANKFISRVGEGSEKVIYYIGKNKTARAEFQALMMEDPSGIKASIFLGEQKARLTGAINKQKMSKAPPPAPDVTNGRVATDSAADLKKRYDAALKKNDAQSILDARRAARSAGIDVSKWNKD